MTTSTVLISKAEQLRGLLRPLDPLHGAVHADDEIRCVVKFIMHLLSYCC